MEPFNHFPSTSSMASSSQCYPLNLANQVQEKMMMSHAAAPGIDLAPMLFSNPFALGEVKLQQQQQQQQQVGLLENLGMGDDEGNTTGGGSAKEKKVGMKGKKPSRPRFAFRTRTDNDILDDGYRWRKYGQKAVKNSIYPRSYYRCTHHSCEVKKQVQRLSKDTSIVVTTYEGVHNHPCEKLMEALAPLIKQIQLLSQF